MAIKNLVSGGAGFLGSHLIDRLLANGEEVFCLDNYITGQKKNISHLLLNNKFQIIEKDVTEPIECEVDKIWHFACPASPSYYYKEPIKTAKINFIGTYNMLELAKKNKARFLLASTSEVYGNPRVHPQNEDYFGNVNFTGKRSCYSEGKRNAESLCLDYFRKHSCEIRVARIFNTYGPRMNPNDGRVIGKFINQILKKERLTINGNGEQTRSFCFIDDLIDGLILLMNSECKEPINLGNPFEISIHDLGEIISKKLNSKFKHIYSNMPEDEPYNRKPCIKKAKYELNWEPKITLEYGLEKTIYYYNKNLF